MTKLRVVRGSYDGAIPWEIYDDSPAEDLARLLCAGAGCQGCCVDGEWFYFNDILRYAEFLSEDEAMDAAAFLANGDLEDSDFDWTE